MASIEELKASIARAKEKAAQASGTEVEEVTESETIERKSQTSIAGKGKAGDQQ